MVGAAWLCLALAGSAPGGGARLVLGERTPALAIVALPKGAAPETSASELTRAADLALRSATGLDLRAPEQAGVDGERLARCEDPGRLACWVASARAEAQARPGTPAIAAILALTVLPVGEGRDRLALTLIDTTRALACREALEAGALGDPGDRERREAVEDCIWASAARTEPQVVARAELPRFFAEAIEQELAPLLEAMGELAPFGRVRLRSATPDVELRVDGAARGTLAAGDTWLEEVRPGRRVLAFARPGLAPRTLPVRVERAETATATIELLSLSLGATAPGRQALLYAGAGAVAAGAALSAYAIARAGAVRSTCLVAEPNAPCEHLGAPTFGLTTGELPSAERDRVNPAGVPIAAVAAGVGLAGATWLLGALLADEGDGFPWITLLAGVGAGALGAALAVGLDPR